MEKRITNQRELNKNHSANYFVPEIAEYYRKKDAARGEVRSQKVQSLTYEEQINMYATVRIW